MHYKAVEMRVHNLFSSKSMGDSKKNSLESNYGKGVWFLWNKRSE